MFRFSVLRNPVRNVLMFGQWVRTTSSVNQVSSENVAEIKPFHAIPGPKGIYQWPVIGTLLNFKPFTKYTGEIMHELLFDLSEKYGPVFKFRMGLQTVVISDPKDFEKVFRNEGKYPRRPHIDILSVYTQRNNIKEGLGQLHGKEWHTLRAPINKKLMKINSATHYLDQQNKVADDLVNIIDTKKPSPEELQDLFFRYASESIAVVTFNKRLGLFEENPDKDSVEFVEASKYVLQIIQDSIFGKLILYKWYGNPTYKRFENACRLIDRVTAKHVASARETLEERIQSGQFNVHEPDLLFSLLSEKTLTDQDVANIMTSLYSGGTDSTAKYIQVFLYNLAKNPEKQEILRHEILKNMGTSGPLTTEALSKMIYLKAALKESFRLYYPTPGGIIRILPDDIILGQYLVPAGTQIMMFNPRPAKTNFENPDQYIPERWLRSEDLDKKDPVQSMIVLPFGFGTRNCVGQRFAVQEIYLAAAKILQRFIIGLEPEYQSVKFIYKLFIQADQPIKFKFTKTN